MFGIIILIIIVSIICLYNKLVRLKKNVEQSFSGIDVYLKQRFDLIPNLVECVKGYSKHEKEVFEKTGLTVSVGIASNKYIAKIASGLNKPDGLCYVENGQEENFMLNLPLPKLWGAGTKTQEKLKSFGFYTTKQIHNAPISTLVTLFGNCTGTFLYKAVRGQEVETFSSEASCLC